MTFGQGQTQSIAKYPLHHMTYAPAKFEVDIMHLQEIFDLTLTQRHMKHCPLHHVTYVPAKFEIATANG